MGIVAIHQAYIFSFGAVPVLHMPMCVHIGGITKFDRDILKFPRDSFIFLYVFDANSYIHRKNPIGAIQAFRLAFPLLDERVGLVLKVMNASEHNSAWQDVEREAAQDYRIRIISGVMERSETLGLIEACERISFAASSRRVRTYYS